MTTTCLIVNVSEEFYTTSYKNELAEFMSMPEIKSVDRIEGTNNLLVEVEASVNLRPVADKILAKRGVKGLRILSSESTKSKIINKEG